MNSTKHNGYQGRRSVGSNDIVETDGRIQTDGGDCIISRASAVGKHRLTCRHRHAVLRMCDWGRNSKSRKQQHFPFPRRTVSLGLDWTKWTCWKVGIPGQRHALLASTAKNGYYYNKLSACAPLRVKTWRHPQNRKYVTHCIDVREGHSHRRR